MHTPRGTSNGKDVGAPATPLTVPPVETLAAVAPGAADLLGATAATRAAEHQGRVGGAEEEEQADCKLLGVFVSLVAICAAGMAGLPVLLSGSFPDASLPQLFVACFVGTVLALLVVVQGLLFAGVIAGNAARRLLAFFARLARFALALLDVCG